MLTLQERSIKVWAEFHLNKQDSNNLVRFAVDLLDSFDTENLRILAGLDKADSEEKGRYFLRVMHEIGVAIPQKDDELLLGYGKIICGEIIRGEIDSLKGLHILSRLFVESGYSRRFSDFDRLETDIMNFHEGIIYRKGFDKTSAERFIPRLAKVFLDSENRSFPDDFWKMIFCNRCNRMGIPKYKKKSWQFLRRHKIQYPVCDNCGSIDVTYCDTVEGKERFLRT